MASEDEALGSVASFGLSSVLASAGIDLSSLGSFLGEGSASSSKQIAEIEAEDNDEDKYEDDISVDGMEGEEDAEQRKRDEERRKREEERWIRKGLELTAAVDKGKGKEKEKTKKDRELEQVMKIWPDFQQGKRLRMSEIFYETPQDRRAVAVQKRKKRRLENGKEFALTIDPSTIPNLPASFLLPSLPQLEVLSPDQPNYKAPIGSFFDKEWVKEARARRKKEMTRPPITMEQDYHVGDGIVQVDWQNDDLGYALELEDWETGIVMCSLDVPASKSSEPLAPRNGVLDSGDWINDVIWDARRVSPDLIDSEEEESAPAETLKKITQEVGVVQPAIAKLDPFNMSNDHLYEHSREARYRIRQTFGAIEVFHSLPARHLQLPFYKTTFTKSEARAWHRPALQFPTGVTFSFSKIKSNPSAAVSSKKNKIVADPSERFKTTKDLSLAEKGPYVLLEFSEEYPPIMSNYGMGTTIVNYYRKKDDKDEHVPKLDFGQPSILNPGDAEPFMLGYVDRGNVTQVIHNNLIRAPIFRHTPETTDFLVIRQTINGHSTFYLRPINHIFSVGQTVPNESEVHAPHARKNTNTSKMRLMIIAWLLIQNSKQKRFKMAKLLKYFPDQTELQMRQRLKEFLTFARGPGPNQGYWMLNPEYSFPSERKEVLELCTPEAAALFEAMQVGARHLHDSGYHKTAEGGQEDEDDSGLDIEQQLAVWSTTHNYKLAEAQKAWLVVHGEGDPTGRGEGFSFLRANMKNYFLRKGETEQGRRLEAEAKAGGAVVKISNAEQNRIYEEEKRKVWDLQWNSLSNPNPPEYNAEDDEEYNRMQNFVSTPAGLGPRFNRGDSRRAFSRGNSMSTYTGANPTAGKVLRIKRKVKGKEVVEIVREPAVIQAYLRRAEDKKLEYYMDNYDSLAPTGNEEEDEIMKAALKKKIEQIKLNVQRRAMRKKYASRTLDASDVDGVDLEGGKRKCGACGQIGHTKANRNCPMFNASSVAPSPSMSTGGGTPSAFGGGYTPVDTTTIDSALTPSTSFKIRLGGGQR
uniref:Transcription initiation factor TFIID subunit 1 n=1 Tax=Kwoniella bestiolae CBS 10118 TaxID=1296100 RepID=A0A1B9GAB1_9TREE|nr:transcription initiation factor TFIID subunit 1 [Kwoniella bestiolae CBS 10118]OCF27962.1 transcription initiation factor TFIID subunit 1 [Kwoniella bestiolae CBS 10118]